MTAAIANRPRDQRGVSLVELMMAVGLTGLVMVPLLGWAGFAMRQQPEVKDDNADASALALLETYVPRDLASARSATDAPTPADECGPPSDGTPVGTTRLALVSVSGRRVTYGTARETSARPGSGRTLWRRECPVAGGAPASTLLVDAVISLTVSCSARPGRSVDPCGQVSLTVDRGARRPLSVVAARRIDSDLTSSPDAGLNAAPTAVITATPATGFSPMAVTFESAGSADPEGGPLTYLWDFADGASSTASQPAHSFDALGQRTVTLTVTDAAGATGTAFVVVTVQNRAPSVSAGATAASAIPGAPIQFTSAGTADPDPGGSVVSYAWSFGDGATASSADPSHAYAAAGTYSAVLTATDNDGGTASAAVIVTVTDPGAPAVGARP